MKARILGIAASVALLAAWSGTAVSQQMEQPIKYTVTMKGAAGVNATGRATLTYSGHTLKYTVSVKDLSGPATMAHIHVGQEGASGPPVYTFMINKVASGKLASGTIDLSKMVSKSVSGDSLKVLLNNGSAYINVHTAAHPGGEIRGQIVRE